MELWQMGAVELGQLIRQRRTTSREVVQAHLDRLADVNPHINAVVETRTEQALHAAGQADQAIRDGHPTSRLHGVPFTLKTNIDLAGSATTHGVPALQHAVAAADSPHVARLREAGAVPLGRTNMPNFGFRWHTDSSLYGPTLNPWDPTRTPGGSSGGDAAAVATGITPLALGNDYGGSIRWPAQACGVTGLRPTRTRVPYHSAAPAELPFTLQMCATNGPIARRVADLRAALQIIAGQHAADPWTVSAPLTGPELPRRAAVTFDPAGTGVSPHAAEAVQRAADTLADAGYAVDRIDPPDVESAARAFAALAATEIRLSPPFWHESLSPGQRRFVEDFTEATGVLTLDSYVRALSDRLATARAWAHLQERYPIILAPGNTHPPFPVGTDTRGSGAVSALIDQSLLVILVNFLDLPAVVTPVGVSGGLPQAVQLIGPRYREDVCLQAAQVLEDRFGTFTPIAPRPAEQLAHV
ncbi:amidase family protein [Acrocarpospora macrocephala]|uniref:Indoleacetamide hydrolase n=1 Tax=Acrocarpospora macrocephala TaxID=150177 RepID=A0A5M3WNM4_9ACTN|nr:amidase [Acrocarpospora macrocephala]GES10534.1 indoleacetamide hydrolase [Acrocarpospora macrocephala]